MIASSMITSSTTTSSLTTTSSSTTASTPSAAPTTTVSTTTSLTLCCLDSFFTEVTFGTFFLDSFFTEITSSYCFLNLSVNNLSKIGSKSVSYFNRSFFSSSEPIFCCLIFILIITLFKNVLLNLIRAVVKFSG